MSDKKHLPTRVPGRRGRGGRLPRCGPCCQPRRGDDEEAQAAHQARRRLRWSAALRADDGHRVMRRGGSVVPARGSRPRRRPGAQPRDRPGGESPEAGGTPIGPTQDRIKAMADTMGVAEFPTYNEGENVYYSRGPAARPSADPLPTGTRAARPADHPDLVSAVAQRTRCPRRCPSTRPGPAAKAAEYDGQTLDTWIRANRRAERFAKLVSAAPRGLIFGTEPTRSRCCSRLLHRGLGQRAEHRHVRAQLQHA